MKNILLLISASLVLFYSCTTQQKVTFNSDWSGKVVTAIDMTAVLNLADEGEIEDSSSIFGDSNSAFKIESLRQISGIKNVKVDSNASYFGIISYEFNDISALNASAYLFSQEVLFDPMHTFFKLNGKNELEFSLPRLKKDGEEDSAGMLNLFVYQLDLEFPREIKYFTSESDSTVKDQKKLSIVSNLSLMMNLTKAQKTIIKLK